MSNKNFNGGRGGITQGKATSVSEHKFGGSHQGNAGGSRGESKVGGSHSRVDVLTPGDTYDRPKGKR